MSERPCFHLSIPAQDLEASVAWYVAVLGCRPGRRSAVAAILDLAGHQLVLQHDHSSPCPQAGIYPRHFGLIFPSLSAWQSLRQRIALQGVPWAVAPKCRYSGEPLEHHTLFVQDPSGNWLEFKHYSHPEAVLGCSELQEVGDRDLRG